MEFLKREHIGAIEVKQRDLSMSYLQKMKQTLTKQLEILNSAISDKKVHKEFKKEKNRIMDKLLEDDVDLSRRNVENEKKIRMNKTVKNQTEKIKINALA